MDGARRQSGESQRNRSCGATAAGATPERKINMKRLAFHIILSIPLASVFGFLGFLLGSPILHDPAAKLKSGCQAGIIAFSLVVVPLSFYYGLNPKSPSSRAYGGNLIRLFCRLLRVNDRCLGSRAPLTPDATQAAAGISRSHVSCHDLFRTDRRSGAHPKKGSGDREIPEMR